MQKKYTKYIWVALLLICGGVLIATKSKNNRKIQPEIQNEKDILFIHPDNNTSKLPA